MKISALIWALLAAIVSTTYFFLIKFYVVKPQKSILVLIILLELLVIFLYYKSVQHSSSGIMYSIINGFSVIMGAAIAVIFFKETITKLDIVGITAIIFGIVILGQKRASVNIK